jgi:hypothetical protein
MKVLTKHYAVKMYGGMDDQSHVFLTSQQLEVSGRLHASALYCQGKNLPYIVDRRIGGPQSWYGRYGEKKVPNITGTRTPTPRPSSRQPVPILISLSRR